MYYYVYRITNTEDKKHYYGSRKSKIHPTQDLGKVYFSSSTNKKFIKDQKCNPKNFKYKIIKTFNASDESKIYESKLHLKFDVKNNINFYNKSNQTNLKFSYGEGTIRKKQTFDFYNIKTGLQHTCPALNMVTQYNLRNIYRLCNGEIKRCKDWIILNNTAYISTVNNTIYKFKNSSDEIFIGTEQEFYNYTNCTWKSVPYMLSKPGRSFKTWKITAIVSENTSSFKSRKNVAYEFYHEQHGYIKDTILNISNKYNVAIEKLSLITISKAKSYKGWSLYDTHKKDILKSNDKYIEDLPIYKKISSIFVNSITNKVEKLLVYDFCIKYNIDPKLSYQILHNQCKTLFGWHIAFNSNNKKLSRVDTRLYSIQKLDSIYTNMTRKQLVDIISCSDAAISLFLNSKIKTLKGYTLI